MNYRRLITAVCSLLVVGCAALVAAAAPASRNASGTIVLVFRDGHRQSFNLSEIDRVEFPAGPMASGSGDQVPRGRFFGKWEAGDGAGGTFTITLKENGEALRSIGNVRGKWQYVNGEARITWDDGAHDLLRRVGSHYQKLAFSSSKSFNDEPDNVAEAHSASPRPI